MVFWSLRTLLSPEKWHPIPNNFPGIPTSFLSGNKASVKLAPFFLKRWASLESRRRFLLKNKDENLEATISVWPIRHMAKLRVNYKLPLGFLN
jgi:hypothetical protein